MEGGSNSTDGVEGRKDNHNEAEGGRANKNEHHAVNEAGEELDPNATTAAQQPKQKRKKRKQSPSHPLHRDATTMLQWHPFAAVPWGTKSKQYATVVCNCDCRLQMYYGGSSRGHCRAGVD